MASNFPTAYVRVASQTYVLQHILTYPAASQYSFCLYLEHTRSAELVLTDNHEKEKDDN